MNAGLAITFVIGGLFMISILNFNAQVINQTQELTLSTINQSNLDNLVDVLANDFNKIGFNTGTAVPFTTISDKNIIFQADVYDNDSYGSTNIRWFFDVNDAVSSTNPNDYYLKRTGPIGTSSYGTIEFPVVYFDLNYYTADGTPTNDLASVKKIEVELMIETVEPYTVTGSTKEYPRLIWKRIFVPNNINLPY
ncbi:MAG: hypothetical protein JJ895_01045 [Balneolaceae bacterium]|nr:hypothetical protein [Balneolaceae bacterium]